MAQRENPIVNRLNKTKVEKFPNLRQEKEERQKELRQKDRAAQQVRVSASQPQLLSFGATSFQVPSGGADASQQKEELRLAREHKEKAWQRDHAYDELHAQHSVAESSNQNGFDEDDFM